MVFILLFSAAKATDIAVGKFINFEVGDYCYLTFSVAGDTLVLTGCPENMSILEKNKEKEFQIMYDKQSVFVPEAGENIDQNIYKSVTLYKPKKAQKLSKADLQAMSFFDATIAYWMGYIVVFILVAIGIYLITLPKSDKRFKKGTKNNAEPLSMLATLQIAIVLYPLLLMVFFYVDELNYVLYTTHNIIYSLVS